MITKSEETRMQEKVWKYRISETDQWNFERWHRWANDERKAWGEPLLNDDEAKLKWDNDIFPKLDEENYE
jgi:hypothetical protein